ncbi:MAG: MFS transporter [Proteobacteria bacterium]|nr:MFS transporter [Pseudomonadota bacterium]
MLLLLLAMASSGFVLQTLSFSLPALVRAWGVDAPALSAAFTLHLLGITAGALAFGRLGDLVGRRRVLLGAAALQGIATLACVACSSTSGLAAMRLLAGMGIGGIAANAVALAVDMAPRRGSSLWTTLVLSGVAVGSSLPALVVHWGAAPMRWQLLFWIGGAGTLLLLPVLALALPEKRQHTAAGEPTDTRGGFRELFAPQRAWITVTLWAAFAGSMLAMHLVTSWLPLLLEAEGHAATRAATLTGWIHAAGVGAVFLSAPAFARFGLHWLSVLLGIAFTSAALLAAFGLGNGALGVLMIAFGFGLVGSQSVLGTLAGHLYPERCRSTGVGAAMAAGRLGSMVGPLAGGAMQAAGYPARSMFTLPLWAIAVALLATGLLASLAGRAGRNHTAGS